MTLGTRYESIHSEQEESLISKQTDYRNKSNDEYMLNIKIYHKRWIMLAIFVTYTLANAFQWTHLFIISDSIEKYYEPSLPKNDTFLFMILIESLSVSYMLMYLIFIIPSYIVLEKYGMRTTAIIATVLNCAGAWLKCLAISPDRYYMLLIGQIVAAIAQAFILGLPARLAAVWFGQNELALATSIGVFGNQIGCALGFVLPPMFIIYTSTLHMGLTLMLISTAIFCSLILLLTFAFFQECPKLPPTIAQAKILYDTKMFPSKDSENDTYDNNDINSHEIINHSVNNVSITSILNTFVHLLKKKNFSLLVLTYGMNTGVYYAIATHLNKIILHYFPGDAVNAGRIGLCLIVFGLIGSIVAGIVLDRTQKFKSLISVLIYIMTGVSFIIYTFTLQYQQLWTTFISASVMGFFMTGYLPVGFEFAAEITYPMSEGASSGLLNSSSQMFGIILTFVSAAMINAYGIISSSCMLLIILILGALFTVLIKENLLRKNANMCTENIKSKVNLEFWIFVILLLLTSQNIRIIFLLMLPQFFTRNIRSVLLSIATILLVKYTIFNIQKNAIIFTDSLICHQKLIKELSWTLYTQAHDKENVFSERILNVVQSVKHENSVGSPFEKCENAFKVAYINCQ
ncbi:Calcium-chelate transporter [Intoshia linei]|uniref:Calcium-chelate transporter n=1 Tax=Intoshia linei TaxID=1819745 RepID=A0A177B9S8_9BILA|nr:Calcium-chelate transporter [Intoshia linei]